MHLEQRFKLGDPVEVSSTCRYFGDWERVPLWIVGVDLRSSGASYSVVEQWPPLFHARADGMASGVTDGWDETDLSPRIILADDDPATASSDQRTSSDRKAD